MSKKWSEVEQMPEYQELSSQDKFNAKREYWNTVVANKQEYSLLPQESQMEAKKEFFGGLLKEDALPQEFQQPNVALETIGGTLKTLGTSGGKMVGGIYQSVRHPLATVKGMGQLAKGLFLKLVPGKQIDEKYADQLGEFFLNRYGSEDAFAETVATDPFGFISDVAMVAGGASGLGKLSRNSAIQRATSLKTIVPATGNVVKGTVSNVEKATNFVIDKSGIKKVLPKQIPFIKKVDQKVFDIYNESFGIKGKKIVDLKTAKQDAILTIKSIKENLPAEGIENPITNEIFTTPRSRYETLLAYQNSKQKIWEKASKLSQDATNNQAIIPIDKVIKGALQKTKEQFGSRALKTDLQDEWIKIEQYADMHKSMGNMNPTEAQGYMKFLVDRTKKLQNSGAVVDYSIQTFQDNFLTQLNNATDFAIENSLQKAGYKYYRKQYAVLRKAEDNLIKAANQQLKSNVGLTGTMANFWSLETALSGDLLKSATIKATSNLLKWARNKDRKIVEMFKLSDKLPGEEITHVFNPELLVTTLPEMPLALPKPKSIPFKRITQTSTGTIIEGENPIKRLTYKGGKSEGVIYGKELTGEYNGGFGQFIMKESPKKSRVIRKGK